MFGRPKNGLARPSVVGEPLEGVKLCSPVGNFLCQPVMFPEPPIMFPELIHEAIGLAYHIKSALAVSRQGRESRNNHIALMLNLRF